MAPTRSKAFTEVYDNKQQTLKQGVSGKRKAEISPIKNDRVKRSALGNLTNALIATDSDENLKKGINVVAQSSTNTKKDEGTKIQPISSRTRAAAKTQNKTATSKGIDTKILNDLLPPPLKKQIVEKHSKLPHDTAVSSKQTEEVSLKTSRRISSDFEKTEESLYVSALEEIPSDISRLSSEAQQTTESKRSNHGKLAKNLSLESEEERGDVFPNKTTKISLIDESLPPIGVEDFDKENWNDPFQVSHYASHIFDYLKTREPFYKIKDYMNDQPELSKWMRSLLIDWMVEVQESFELNHETLYLAVKIVDTYLGKTRVSKDSLQLLGAASLLIACKYDERTPPLIDDFLFICDGAYKRVQLLKMEMNVFKAIDFDLAFPLSYRFLRRYARCGKISMVALTLARYILEFCLMDYSTIQLSDSKMACAALFMSLKMNEMEGWNATYEHYSGYKLIDFAPIVVLLNSLLHRKPKETLSTVRNKYSHKIFHQVTNIPLLDINKLFDNFPDVAKQLSGLQLTYQSIIATCSSASSSATLQSEPKTPKIYNSATASKHRSMPLPLIG